LENQQAKGREEQWPMAYRDAEMEPSQFIEWILGVKRAQMWGIGTGPAITVVNGCTGYVLTGKSHLREIVSDVGTGLAARAS
jgi:hypothetical protein